MVIFNIKSADVVLKIITILKEMRILQLCSKSEQTLGDYSNFGLPSLKLRKEKFGPNCQFLRFGNDCSQLILSLSLPHEECDHDGDR